MQEEAKPLLTRRRLGDENNPPSSHNLIDRNRHDEEEDEEEGVVTDYGSAVYRYPPYLQPGHFTSLEKLMFFTSSLLLILLCVFVGLYARSSQQSPVYTPSPRIPKNHTKKQDTCLNSNCIIVAAQLLEDVDQELDPCDDFYEYTCSRWKQHHIIPDVKSRIDVPSLMTDSIRRRLDQILNRDFDASSLGLPNPHAILDRQLFEKVRTWYTSCMDQDTIEKEGIQPLYPLFRSIRDYIPINNYKEAQVNKAVHYLSEQDIWPLFEFKVETDINTTSTPILSIHTGQLGLHDTMYNDPDIMQVYMQVVTSILDIVFKKDVSNEFGWKSWSSVATARRIIEFEKKMANISTHHGQPVRLKMSDLQAQVPHIDWTQWTQTPTHVLVPYALFTRDLAENILSDMNSRTLQVYFIWRTIWHHLDVLNEEFAVQKRKLDAKLSGIAPRAAPERWEMCIDALGKSSMGILLGRYYIKDRRDVQEAKKTVQDLAHSITQHMANQVPNLPWIGKEDHHGKQELLKKLQAMTLQIGYPTAQPDLQSAISLSEYFGDVDLNKKEFFVNTMKLNQHRVKQHVWHAMEQSTLDTVWNAHDVQVAYNAQSNKVILPAGLLRSPFVNTNGPAYFYYGSIGWLIGHQITHGFDTIGRMYNSDGQFGSWWHDETIHNLDLQNQCLITQYQSFGINGKETLNNNFADLGGVSVMEFLLRLNQDNRTIPGLEDWTRDQLAYVQFARMKCSKSTKEHKRLNKEIAADRYRINGPLMNSDHFASTFGCKKGSVMNPAIKKCGVVWQ